MQSVLAIGFQTEVKAAAAGSSAIDDELKVLGERSYAAEVWLGMSLAATSNSEKLLPDFSWSALRLDSVAERYDAQLHKRMIEDLIDARLQILKVKDEDPEGSPLAPPVPPVPAVPVAPRVADIAGAQGSPPTAETAPAQGATTAAAEAGAEAEAQAVGATTAAAEAGAEAPAEGAEKREPDAAPPVGGEAVSYTHLTLPTICSV
eukprot:7514552-Alexandrium_andersonii.AAC.1